MGITTQGRGAAIASLFPRNRYTGVFLSHRKTSFALCKKNLFVYGVQRVRFAIRAPQSAVVLSSSSTSNGVGISKEEVEDFLQYMEWCRMKEAFKDFFSDEDDSKDFQLFKDFKKRMAIKKKYRGACGGADNGFGPFGQNLGFKEVMKETEARGVSLPLDLLLAAKNTGIPEFCLYRYLHKDEYGLGLGFAMSSWSMVRNQMMFDPMYLPRLVEKFGDDAFLDIAIATGMNLIGRDSNEIAIFLWYRLFQKAATQGLLAPYDYAQRILRQLEEFLDTSLFVAQRYLLLIRGAFYFGCLYWGAALIFAICMIQLFAA